jgi:hypothetical protein
MNPQAKEGPKLIGHLEGLETWCTHPPLFEADYKNQWIFPLFKADYKNKISISIRRPEICRCIYESEEVIYWFIVILRMKLKGGGGS